MKEEIYPYIALTIGIIGAILLIVNRWVEFDLSIYMALVAGVLIGSSLDTITRNNDKRKLRNKKECEIDVQSKECICDEYNKEEV